MVLDMGEPQAQSRPVVKQTQEKNMDTSKDESTRSQAPSESLSTQLNAAPEELKENGTDPEGPDHPSDGERVESSEEAVDAMAVLALDTPATAPVRTETAASWTLSGTVPVQETGRGQGVEESNTGTDAERIQAYRRDRVKEMIDNQTDISSSEDASFSFDFTIPDLPPAQRAVVYQQIINARRELQRNLDQYGVLIGLKKKCVQFTFSFETLQQVLTLEKDLISGVFFKTVAETCNLDKDVLQGIQVKLNYSREELKEIQKFIEAKVLHDDVSYTYCKKRQSFLWSSTGEEWISVHNVPLTSASEKPKQEDITMIVKLRTAQLKKDQEQSFCLICADSVKVRETQVYEKDSTMLGTEIYQRLAKQLTTEKELIPSSKVYRSHDIAMKKISKVLSQMRPDKKAYINFEAKLKAVENGTWKEDLQVRKYYGISKFEDFADDLKTILDLPEEESDQVKSDLLFSHRHGDEHDVKTLDVVYNVGAMDVRYVCFALYHHDETNEKDLIFAHYTLSATARERKLVKEKKYSGFLHFFTEATPYLATMKPDKKKILNLIHDEDRDEFFRYKIVDGFASEGLLERDNAGTSGLVQAELIPVGLDTEDHSLIMLQQAIYSMECNMASFRRFQEKLQGFEVERWTEKVDVRKHFGIKNFQSFLVDLRDRLNLPEKDYRDLKCNYLYVRHGEVKKVEVNYSDGQLSTRYVFYAIYKRANSNITDMVYAYYKLSSSAAKKTRVEKGTRSYFWGLYKTTFDKQLEEKEHLNVFESLKTDIDRDNYLRYRVINAFVDRGLADKKKLKTVEG